MNGVGHAVAAMPRLQGRPRTRIRSNRAAFLSFLVQNGCCMALVVALATRFSAPHAVPSSHADRRHAVAAMLGPQGAAPELICSNCTLSFLARNGRCATRVVAFSTRFSSPHAVPSSHADHRHAVTAMQGPHERPRTRYVAIFLLASTSRMAHAAS